MSSVLEAPPRRDVEFPDGLTTLDVLQRLTKAAGILFDGTTAIKALRQAEYDFPESHPSAAKLRLSRGEESQGLQLLPRHLSLKDAFEFQELDVPLALPLSADRWLLLTATRGGKGHIYGLSDNPKGDWLSPQEVAERLGIDGGELRLEWLTVLVAQPLAEPTGEALIDSVDEEHHRGISPQRRLVQLLWPERRDIGVIIVYSVGVGILSLAVPITVAAVVNNVAFGTTFQPLIVLSMALFVCLSLAAVLRGLKQWIVETIQQRVFVRVVADLSYRLPRVCQKSYDRQHGPELVNRFFDVLTVQKASSALLLEGVSLSLQTLVGLILLATYHQLLFGFDLFLIGALVFIVWVLGQGAVSSAIRESRAKYAVAGWVEEMARHPFAFKLSGGATFALERSDGLAREYLLARRTHFRVVMRQFCFALGLQVVASTLLLGLGGYLVIISELSLGQLVAAELIVALVVSSFTKFGKQLEAYYDLMAAVEKLGHLIDLPLERAGGLGHHTDTRQPAHLRVRDVGFGYDHGHRKVLSRLNLEVKPGERVALMGPNGAGKSTLVDLLFGLRDPEEGYIELDNVDLRDLRLEALRGQLVTVKGIEIFEGTLMDNVRMGRDEVSIADIRHALESVGLLDEVLELPRGLHTRLGTGGAPLSFGQAQRLMVARAILGKPRMLIVDELLDDMDLEVRHQVLEVILNRGAPWSLLIVTHSPDIASMCDRVYRLPRTRWTSANEEAHR